ncbi:gpi transamidase component gaa1 [Diplodia corticola]|uniref:Gpi transamidase component gaa1 n=1 Tax=Diplodia corticola TaxID=236234 RepID=A0A1J9RCA2_9PEZI|nr:gpi transamidase component gaa1 [Diplodia corticola]OJD38081.1 gpi transamidase component gaa1 [Diplodia corticola]
MALLTPAILGLRRDARILKIPPYLSALCIVVGVIWLFLLPLNDYSRQTYISENALLPGQVHTYFGGSEHNIFRAFRHEVHALVDKDVYERNQALEEILKSAGLKTARQKYSYKVPGKNVVGENVYGVIQGPRADATEAVVLVASWETVDGEINQSGVALALTLARYFKRWSLWSKDIIVLITSDTTAGSQAWVDAYHNTHDPSRVEALPLKSGALQGAVAIEYPAGPWGHRFDKLHLLYDGVNGQLPNLDLFNTAVSIASGQMGIGCTLQRMWNHQDTYEERLQTMLRGMISQGLGHASGPHSAFIPYHVDAITIQTTGSGWNDEMSLGRTVESLFRSLNNLLEHLHQSFFFYLLMQANRFVSIGTYLPSAMLIAVNFTITAIALWVQSGRPPIPDEKPASTETKDEKKPDMTVVREGSDVAIVPSVLFKTVERNLILPLALVSGVHFLGLIPLTIFNHTSSDHLGNAFILVTVITLAAPPLTSFLLTRQLHRALTTQETCLLQCFSLLLLGMFFSALATLNFSLSFLVGLCAAPLTFVRPPSSSSSSRNRKLLLAGAQYALLVLFSPVTVVALASQELEGKWLLNVGEWMVGGGGGGGGGGGVGGLEAVRQVLMQAAFGWHVWGLWTQVVVWLVWWPAWFAGAVVVSEGFFA